MSAEPAPLKPALTAQLTLSRPGGFVLDVSLALPRGVTVLLGPSGSGKSTTLDLIAGYLTPDRGRIELDGQALLARGGSEPQLNVPVQERCIGYVMQSPALFPHLRVHANLTYGLFGWPTAARSDRLAEIAQALDLGPLLGRWPQSLSGGERQRVALGRALAPRPRALLLDEPLSAVDLRRRDALLEQLRTLLGALAIPVLYVTHSAEEQRFFAAAHPPGPVLRMQPRQGPGGDAIEIAPVLR